MTPKKAIHNECCWCMNTQRFNGCSSDVCKLNYISMTYVQRIKANCLTCCPEQSIFGVQGCDGKISNFNQGRICPLHPFRLGKNPSRVAAGKMALTDKLASFQFKKGDSKGQGKIEVKKGV